MNEKDNVTFIRAVKHVVLVVVYFVLF